MPIGISNPIMDKFLVLEKFKNLLKQFELEIDILTPQEHEIQNETVV